MYDIAVVGDGIVGTLLTYELIQSGKKVLWLGSNQATSSYFSGALINPVAGKHLKVNTISLERYQFAVQYYQHLSERFNQEFLVKHDLLFFNRSLIAGAENDYVNDDYFQTENTDIQAVVRVKDVYKVQQQQLFETVKQYNQAHATYLVAQFSIDDLVITNEGLTYHDLKFEKLVFCEGVRGFKNPLFTSAPFTINYGNVLIAKIKDLDSAHIYDLGKVRIVPNGEDVFWCGGNTIWNTIPENQLSEFEAITRNALTECLGIHHFEVVSHQIVQRPTIAGQQPLFESSAQDQRMMRINGLGTRGYSATPKLIHDIIHQL